MHLCTSKCRASNICQTVQKPSPLLLLSAIRRGRCCIACTFRLQHAGKVIHTHSGGNKAKLEHYLREATGDKGDTVYPPYQLTGVRCAAVDNILPLTFFHPYDIEI